MYYNMATTNRLGQLGILQSELHCPFQNPNGRSLRPFNSDIVFGLLFSLLGCERSCDRGFDGSVLIFKHGGGSVCRRRRRL
jgi:hypothetical protein